MGRLISTDAGDLDLDDSSILAIRRGQSEVRVALNFARLWQGNSPSALTLERPDLLFQGVRGEQAIRYFGHKVVGTHPDPSQPLDLIEVVEYSKGKIELHGYLNAEPWYVWEIRADSLSVHWSDRIANAT